MKPAVSVIVLVYNSEKYLAAALESLFSQTFEDIEYVIVDDGSTDGSMGILQNVLAEFPRRRGQVKIVSNGKNLGQAAGRRRGVEASTAEYVIHCDSDDWVEPDYISSMYSRAVEDKADAVVCRYFEDDREVASGFDARSGVRYADLIAVREMVSVWRFLFRRELYSRGVIFPENNQGEDQALVAQLAFYSNHISVVDRPLYHWRVNMESITRNPSPEAVLNRFNGACANSRLVESFMEREGVKEKYADQLTALKLYSMFYMRPLLRKGEGVEEFRKEFPEIKGHVIFNKEINFVHKVEYLVANYCPASVIKLLYRWRKSSQ